MQTTAVDKKTVKESSLFLRCSHFWNILEKWIIVWNLWMFMLSMKSPQDTRFFCSYKMSMWAANLLWDVQIWINLFHTVQHACADKNNLVAPVVLYHPKWSLKVCGITGNDLSQPAELSFYYGPCLSIVTMAIVQSSVFWNLWECQQWWKFLLWF